VSELAFLIIFGTAPHERRRKGGFDGILHCPKCRSPQHMVEMDAVRAFKLYWVALFDTAFIGRFVECQECHGRFDVPPELGGPFRGESAR
jgi:hypothetical protein